MASVCIMYYDNVLCTILVQYNHTHDRGLPAVLRKQLTDIVQRGPLAQIDELEKDLIWRFRYIVLIISLTV